MALNVKHPQADLLARQLASLTGETLTEAILKALQERLERQRTTQRTLRAKDLLRDTRERLSRYPVLDPRSPDEILGYDEKGLPH